jgi:hypothetical protein
MFGRTFCVGDEFARIPILHVMRFELIAIVYLNTTITEADDVQVQINVPNAVLFPYGGSPDIDMKADFRMVDPPSACPPCIRRQEEHDVLLEVAHLTAFVGTRFEVPKAKNVLPGHLIAVSGFVQDLGFDLADGYSNILDRQVQGSS